MHPAFAYWWKKAEEYANACGHGCDDSRQTKSGPRRHGCGPALGAEWFVSAQSGDFGGGSFGVRRPLRFLAYKLDLSEAQVAELARILNELKTERAQAEVDGRRTVTSFADAVSAASFDEAKADEGARLRIDSAERLRAAVLKALREIHALLNDEQRKELAYLIRTGAVTL
jgi:Spy/CpxP family protein refolding chaperone